MEDKKRNIPLFILAIVLLLLSCCLIITGILIQTEVIKFDLNNKKTEEVSDDIILEEELDVNDSKIINLYTKVVGKDNLEKHEYKVEYLDSFYYKINNDILVSDIDNDDLLKIMWFNFKDSSIKTDIDGGFTVRKDEFQKLYESIFGNNLTYSKDTTSTSADACLKVNYNTTNNNYEFYNNCLSTSNIIVYPKIIKATKTDKEINLYVQVGFVNNNILYSDIELKNKVIDRFNEEEINKYGSYLNTYIYTFNIDEYNNYYFYKIGIE